MRLVEQGLRELVQSETRPRLRDWDKRVMRQERARLDSTAKLPLAVRPGLRHLMLVRAPASTSTISVRASRGRTIDRKTSGDPFKPQGRHQA